MYITYHAHLETIHTSFLGVSDGRPFLSFGGFSGYQEFEGNKDSTNYHQEENKNNNVV